MKLIDKLDLLMKNAGLSRRQFALQAGIPYMTIVNFYEKGTDNIKLSTLRKITSFFDISLDYLTNDQIINPDYGKTTGFRITCPEMQMIQQYRSLDLHGKDLVDTVLQKEYQRKQDDEDALHPGGSLELRHYWDAPSAGLGNDLNSGGYDRIRVPATATAQEADFALTVSGNSMEPLYCDGDLILVKAQTSYEIGDTVVFSKNGESFVKLAGERCFESINPDYPDISIHEGDSFHCFGIVLGKL